jgi:hypothetical protein
VRIRVFRGLVHGGGGSAGVVNGGETPMAILRFNSVLGSSIGLLRGVLRPLLTTYLRWRRLSGTSSVSRPCSRARRHRHGGHERLPRWLLSPSLMRTVCPLPRRIDLAPSLLLYRLDLEGTTSPWPCAGHGEHALDTARGGAFPRPWRLVPRCLVLIHVCVRVHDLVRLFFLPLLPNASRVRPRHDLVRPWRPCAEHRHAAADTEPLWLGQAIERAHHVCVCVRSTRVGRGFCLDGPRS